MDLVGVRGRRVRPRVGGQSAVRDRRRAERERSAVATTYRDGVLAVVSRRQRAYDLGSTRLALPSYSVTRLRRSSGLHPLRHGSAVWDASVSVLVSRFTAEEGRVELWLA